MNRRQPKFASIARQYVKKILPARPDCRNQVNLPEPVPALYPSQLPLPPEIIIEIIEFLPTKKSLETFSRVSRQIRTLALPFIFGHLRYSVDVQHKIRSIHQAKREIKESIRTLELLDDWPRFHKNAVLFDFLRSLPNLRAVKYDDVKRFSHPLPMYQLFASLQHAPILELDFRTSFIRHEEPLTVGLSGLEKLTIYWHSLDKLAPVKRRQIELPDLIRPSLSTLVELKIHMLPGYKPYTSATSDLDLQLLKHAGSVLRTLEYYLWCLDESILDTIPDVFPHLTTLSINWVTSDPYGARSLLWKESHDFALSKNKNLINLKIFAQFGSDDEYADWDRHYETRSKERLKATVNLASMCRNLRECVWYEPIQAYRFEVEPRGSSDDAMRSVRQICD